MKRLEKRHEKKQFCPAPPAISLDEARKLAEAKGVALNQLINVAVAEKVSALHGG